MNHEYIYLLLFSNCEQKFSIEESNIPYIIFKLIYSEVFTVQNPKVLLILHQFKVNMTF